MSMVLWFRARNRIARLRIVNADLVCCWVGGSFIAVKAVDIWAYRINWAGFRLGFEET